MESEFPERPMHDDDAPVTRTKQAQFVLDRFVQLLDAAGGIELDERCTPFELPAKLHFAGEPSVMTCGCGNLTMFELSYEDEDGESKPIQACAICDAGLNWPRILAHAR